MRLSLGRGTRIIGTIAMGPGSRLQWRHGGTQIGFGQLDPPLLFNEIDSRHPLLILKNGLIHPHHKCLVNLNFTEFVDNNRDALAVLRPQDIVEKRGLARAETAGENGVRYGTHRLTLQEVRWGFIRIFLDFYQ